MGQPTGEKRASLPTIVLLLVPVALHGVGVAISVPPGRFNFRALDGAFLLGLCVYVALIMFAVREHKRSRKLALLVYAVLVPVLAFEALAFALGHTTGYGLPVKPLRIVATAAGTMPGIEGEIRFTVTKRGVRAPELWPASRDDRILCVGGSTTECLYVTDEKSWPWLLGTRLTEKLGREVLVASAGRSGHLTPHHLYQLRHYKHADEFGVVVVLCGMNDAGALLRGNYENRAAAAATEALYKPPRRGAYYRFSYLVNALGAPSRRPTATSVQQDPAGNWYVAMRRKRQELLGTNTIRSVPAELQASLDTYRSNLIEIITLCSTRGQRLIFLTQPTLYQENMPDDLAAIIWQHTDTGAHTPEVLAEVISAFNATLEAVCAEYTVPCVDLASQLPKDTSVFYDDCHFNLAGCDATATIVRDALVGVLDRRQ